MYHDLKVDGVSLKGYKVYINGTGAYDSAERDVEFIEIPGRSGAFALDKKRFKNITVQYNSGTFAENQPEFARKISDLRNFLASRDGYVRIEDDYNPEEYRMGVFSRGLEFDPVCYNMASEFPIEFNCKPQRFLKIGDLPVSVASGDVITNPTLFDAHPLIKFNSSGDGTIRIGDRPLNFLNKPLGRIPIGTRVIKYLPSGDVYYRELVAIQNTPHNNGDTFTFKGAELTTVVQSESDVSVASFTPGQDMRIVPPMGKSGNVITVTVEDWEDTTFTFGTAKDVTKSVEFELSIGGQTYTQTLTMTMSYAGFTQIQVEWVATLTSGVSVTSAQSLSNYTGYADSSVNSLTGDLYIDLDIGEAYRMQNGVAVSINNFVNIGGELPVLPPGSTTITYSNTISNVEITPRYWRV